MGRGYYSIKCVEKLHYWLKSKLREKGAHIDGIFYGPFYERLKLKFTKKDKQL